MTLQPRTLDTWDSPLRGRFGTLPEPSPPLERRLRVPLAAIDRAAAELAAHGARFVTLFLDGQDERSLCAVFAFQGELVLLRAPLGRASAYPTLSLQLPACRWAEREIYDRHGLVPLAHPDLRPLLRPDADTLDLRVSGPEAFAIPYGPIRSGVFEAVQFVIETAGEDVLAVDVRPLFKHRGLESRFSGLSLGHACFLAERVAGVSSVAHAVAFAQAVERALGVEPPPRAQLWRTILCELERIANHLDVAVRLAEDAALGVGAARFAILKEDVLRLQAELTGSRFGRGLVCPGGIRRRGSLPPGELARRLSTLERDVARDRSLLLRTTSFTDRLIGSGRLDRTTVEAFAGVGPVARACGISTDARFERPYAAYGRLGFEVVTREEGDAMARLEVRFGEVAQSLHLIRQALDRLQRQPDDLRAPLPHDGGAACGWSEAAQGEVVYWVDVEGDTIAQVHIASPSFRNWPLFGESFRGDVLTDFAFIEHSFGLTPAGASR
jgi:Ni,Fe-hydrogenase III large subunit